MIRTLTLAALAVVLVGPMARAQSTAGSAPVNDSLFAEAAAVGGVAEVSLSEIGLKRASDPELKKFSQQMIDEHTKLNHDLTALAAKKRIPMPRTVDVRSQFCAQSLMGTPTEKFDHCYAKAQLVAHSEAVATFEAEAERGQDAEMKALAAKALPSIKEHLSMIKPIAMKYEKDQKDQPANTEKKDK